MLELLALLVLAILAATLASAAEVAVFGLAEDRLKALVETQRRSARSLAKLRARPVRLLATLWTARIAATALAALAAWAAVAPQFGPSMLLPVTATVVAILALMLAKFLARILALRNLERLSLAAAAPLLVLTRVLQPVIWPAELLARGWAPKVAHDLPRITDREIRALVSPGNGEPEIEEHERRLIQRAFLLDQTTAYEVMTPRVDMFAWRDTLSLAEIAPELRSVRYSRVPVYSGSIDNVTGVLYARDAYQALVSGQRDVKLRDLAREPIFVPGSVTLEVLLLDFQSRRIHMGIVIDEYGGVDGLVTLEDILEELVGEIVDETDVAEDSIVRLGRNEILVDGGADLREINHFFNSTFPLLEHRSLNGYLLDVLGRVPKPGEKLVREGVQIEVVRATDKHVVSVRLSRPGAKAPDIETDGVRSDEQGSQETEPATPKDDAPPAERPVTGGSSELSRRSPK